MELIQRNDLSIGSECSYQLQHVSVTSENMRMLTERNKLTHDEN